MPDHSRLAHVDTARFAGPHPKGEERVEFHRNTYQKTRTSVNYKYTVFVNHPIIFLRFDNFRKAFYRTPYTLKLKFTKFFSGRLDGAFCDYTEEDKFKWFKNISVDKNVINFEMEAALFLAMCNRAQVRGACTCVTIVDRLKNDKIVNSKGILIINSFKIHQI